MNVYTFSGDIPRPAEQRRTQSDKAVVSFTVPVKSGFGDNEVTTWVDCTLWGKRRVERYVISVSGKKFIKAFDMGEDVGVSGFELLPPTASQTLDSESRKGPGKRQRAKALVKGTAKSTNPAPRPERKPTAMRVSKFRSGAGMVHFVQAAE